MRRANQKPKRTDRKLIYKKQNADKETSVFLMHIFNKNGTKNPVGLADGVFIIIFYSLFVQVAKLSVRRIG